MESKYIDRDAYYIEKALEEIERILESSNGIIEYDLQNNREKLDSIVFRLIQLSEHVDRVSDVFKLTHPEINWRDIKSFRNRLVHDYGDVDIQFVYDAISKDIVELKEVFVKLIQK